MKTTNLSGNEQNVTNLEVLISVIISFGPTYNPPKSSITIPGLNELLEKGKLEINALNAAEVASKNAVAACTAAQDDFDSLITRSINALRILDVSAQTLAQAEALVRELRGKRASALLTAEEQAAAKVEGNTSKQVVKHNSTLDSKLENMSKYVLLLESIPGYNPNEPELTTPALRNKLNDIKAKDTQVTSTDTAFGAARLSRDAFLYTDNTGLCPIVSDAKTYVKSVFGANSPQYKQVSSIKFFKRK